MFANHLTSAEPWPVASGVDAAATYAPPLPAWHRLWRGLPPRSRRQLLARGVALCPRPDRRPPPPRAGVAVAGELARASGLGEGARAMLAALAHWQVPAWAIELDSRQVEAASRPPPSGAPLVMHVNAPLLPAALWRLGRALRTGRRVIGYWAWESTVLPPEWRCALPFVHEVWTPSRFAAQAIAAQLPSHGSGGVSVRVVPHPLALVQAPPAALDRAAFGLPPGGVVVLLSFSLAAAFERKNPLGAIAAFRAAFGRRRDRLLLIKLVEATHAPADLARLRVAIADAPNVRIDDRALPAADHRALLAAADIVLSLHRGEGFGLVPAEAMLLGRPVVATGWSGNMDYMDADSAALVGYRLVPAHDARAVYALPGALWAEPDLGEAAAQLRRLADDPQARLVLGRQARATARRRLSGDELRAELTAMGLLR